MRHQTQVKPSGEGRLVPAALFGAACLLAVWPAWADDAATRARDPSEPALSQAVRSEDEAADPLADELDGATLVAVAYKLLEGGDDAGAEEAFLAALSVEPENLDAREGLVWTYVRRGDFERAAEAADARLALDPDGLWRDQWLSVIRLAPSRREEAIEAYRLQIAASVQNLDAHLRLAELLVWSSRFGEAIEVYRDAVKADPQSLEASLGLAAALSYAGERAEADTIFEAVLEDHPHNLDALLGRARSARWSGDWDGARRYFDRALLASGIDQALVVERVQLELDPALLGAELAAARAGADWRDEAIARYRQQADADPTAVEPRLRLAELLSWITSRRAESVAVYREALDIEPTNTEARIGLAVVLSWQGEREEANALFDAVIDDEPDNVEALLGRSRAARWEGDWDTARELFDRALVAAPSGVELVTERAQLEVDPALQAAEIATIESRASGGSEPLRSERLTQVGVYPTAAQDSEDFRRLSVRVAGQTYPWTDTRLRLLARWTRFEDNVDALDRLTFGGDVRQELPLGFYLRGLYLAQLYSDAPNATEYDIEGGLQNPGWPVAFRVGYWQHGIVDELRTHDEIAQIEGVGSGGMSVAAMRNDVQVRDVYGSVSASPLAGTYVYGTAAFGMINDDNQRLTIGGGLGFDTLFYAALSGDHELYVKYDFFYLSFVDEQPDYWTPQRFQVHTPGLAWTWRAASRWTVGAEAGAPIDPSDGSVGYLVGAFSRFTFADHWFLQARLRAIDDTEYAVFAGTIGAGYIF